MSTTKKKIIIGGTVVATLGLVIGLAVGIPLSQRANALKKAIEILDSHPLIDGHNDLAHVLRKIFKNQFNSFDLSKNMTGKSHTDLVRAKEGKLGGQFWAVYASCDSSSKDALRLHMEQAEVIKRFVSMYPEHLAFTTTAQEIRDAFKNKKLASLLGMESGHAIDSSLSILRMFYNIGVRYMTLTHNCNTPWATNHLVDRPSTNASTKVGLTAFGRLVIKEMNRLGMLVDLSHTSYQTQLDALEESKAPVIYSHSSVRALCGHTRNVRDEALQKLKKNNGVIMINFYNGFTTCNETVGSTANVIEHINYVKNLIGIDHVGIGSDFDGISDVPTGLEDVSKYPNLFAELIKQGWKDEDLAKLAGGNILRALEDAEKYAKSVKDMAPLDDIISQDDLVGEFKNCRTSF